MVGTVFAVAGACARPAAAQTAQAAHVYLSDGVARSVVARAIAGAQRRLDRPACLLVLNDFTDASGQPLLDVLAATGRQAGDYLAERVWFVDGGATPQCRGDEGMAAFTAADSKVVHVCAGHFALLARRPTLAEMLIIHELLHTLGLNENPPASAEITSGVTNRCGGS